MRKLALLSIVATTLVFSQEVVIQKNMQMDLNPNIEKVADGYAIVDFCVKGLLYRGFEANGTYMTSKTVLEPASFHQVIGSDGKPMTCRLEEK